jgi:serine/threonine-protein kinase
MTLVLPLAEALHERFLLGRELGRGGMATVYLAHDLKHDRLVALKVLRPDLAALLGPERFLQEIRFTAHLHHPHILPVFDSGEAEGQLWYTMPYVEGESLRERLRREGRLPVADALHIAGEVAEALDHSHRHGVVHRDIKPENILLDETHAVLADFGIARDLSRAVVATAATTSAGVVLGSPAYMSPEQAMGETSVDGRTDIYALGCVLYEMLSGAPPLMAPAAQAVLARRVSEPAPHVSAVLKTVSPDLDAVIAKSLAPLPADRFTTAAEFARSLKSAGVALPEPGADLRGTRRLRPGALETVRPSGRLLAAVLIGLGLLLAVGLMLARGGWPRTGTAEQSPGSQRIAVLRFESIGDTAARAFADGMSEELTSRLARVPGLRLVARSSAREYHRSGQTAADFGRALGVDYVLDGTVRVAIGPASERQVRITPELIKVADGSRVWGGLYGGVAADVFRLQADVAGQVAEALHGTLGGDERRAVRRGPTMDLEAYRLYVLGRAEWNRREPENLERAAEYFRQAIARDSTFAKAWAGLADAYAIFGVDGVLSLPPEAAYARARAAALRAIALDSTLPEPHASLNQILRYGSWDWAGSERAVRRAIALDPYYATAHQWLAEHLLDQGRLDEGIAEARIAVQLDPLVPSTHNVLGHAYWWSGRIDEAVSVYRAALAQDSTSELLSYNLLQVYLTSGRTAAALALLAADRDTSTFYSALARAPHDPRARTAALAQLERFKTLRSPDWTHSSLARHYAMLGERQAALAELELAVAARDPNLEAIKVDPSWASVRDDDRFAAVMAQIGVRP